MIGCRSLETKYSSSSSFPRLFLCTVAIFVPVQFRISTELKCSLVKTEHTEEKAFLFVKHYLRICGYEELRRMSILSSLCCSLQTQQSQIQICRAYAKNEQAVNFPFPLHLPQPGAPYSSPFTYPLLPTAIGTRHPAKSTKMDHDLIKLVNKLQDTFNNLGTRKFVLFGVLSILNEVQRRRVGHASASCSTCCSRRQSDCLY